MAEKTLDLRFHVRSLFLPYVQRTQRSATIMSSRRHGKTYAAIQDIILRAATIARHGPEPRFSYVGPTGDQAKDIAWPYFKQFLGSAYGVDWSDSELALRIPRTDPTLPKSLIKLYSGNNYERMRGLYNDGVLVDEGDDISPNAWKYVIRATLTDYKGWNTFTGTPKGKGALHQRLTNSDSEDRHYKLIARADECGIIEPDELDEIRREIGDSAYSQEYLCDTSAPIPGAIYAAAINKARNQRRIADRHEPMSNPYWTVWDIGSPLNTSVWTFQIVQGQYVFFRHCDAGVDWSLPTRCANMIGRGYNYAGHIIPHDGDSKLPGGLSFREELEKCGLTNVSVVPRTDNPLARIEMTSRMFDRFYFDKDGCEYGLDALNVYRRRYNDKLKKYEEQPYHDWASHVADSIGMVSEASQHGIIKLSTGSQSVALSRRGRASLGLVLPPGMDGDDDEPRQKVRIILPEQFRSGF